MKRLLLFFFLTTKLFADEPCFIDPFGLSGTFLQVSPAHMRSRDLEGSLRYTQSNAALAYTHPCSPCWGLIFGSGWVGTEVHWKENPFFREDHFDYVTLNLGAYTQAMPGWNWTLTATMFVDTAILDLGNYALYQGVLYGKYELAPCFLFDVGCILEVGLNKSKMWPIFGIEWDPCERLSLNLVYPLDVSLEYYVFPSLMVGGSIRFLRDRHRLLNSEPIPTGVYEYQTSGGEFDIVYTPWSLVQLGAFAGRTFPGHLKLTDHGNHHPTYAKFKGSFYAGGTIIISF